MEGSACEPSFRILGWLVMIAGRDFIVAWGEIYALYMLLAATNHAVIHCHIRLVLYNPPFPAPGAVCCAH